MAISKEPLTYSYTKDGPPFPQSKELFDFAVKVVSRRQNVDEQEVSVMEIYRAAGYSGSFSRYWRQGKENFSNINKMFQLAEFLEVDPLVCMEILAGRLSADEAAKLAVSEERLEEYKAERPKLSSFEERIIMSFSDRLRAKIMKILDGGQLGDDEFFDTREVAELFKVSQRTVQWWVDTGKLVCARTSGRHSRITYSDIMNFIRERNVYNPLAMFINRRVLVIDTASTAEKLNRELADFRAVSFYHADTLEAGLLMAGIQKPDFVVLTERKAGDALIDSIKALKGTDGYTPLLVFVIGDKDKAKYEKAGADLVMPKLDVNEFKKAFLEEERKQLSRPRRLRSSRWDKKDEVAEAA
jgi:excisionase family DNA binding protein